MMMEPSSQAMNLTKPSLFQFPQVANSSQSQRSPTLSNGSSNQEEDNYHQYHEALDPPTSVLHSPTIDNSRMSSPLLPNFNARSPLLEAVIPPPPPQTHPNFSVRSLNDHVTNSATSNALIRNSSFFNHQNMANQDMNMPSDGNNNMKLVHDISHEQNNHRSPTMNAFNTHSRNVIQQNHALDVSEDIYLVYVTQSKEASKNPRYNPQISNAPLFSTSDTCVNHQEKYEEVVDEPTVDKTPINSPTISPSTSNLKNSVEPIELRYHCIRELIETESNYVNALEMIIDCFARPLEKYLRKEDAMLIFNHIKQFQRIHHLFHGDLVKSCKQNVDNHHGFSGLSPFNSNVTIHATSNPTTPTSLVSIPSPHTLFQSHTSNTLNISPAGSFKSRLQSSETSIKLSSCFLHWKDKFVLYGDYCSTLSKAQNLIDELCSKNELFAIKIERCQHDANEGKFKLRDLLSLPMQRILKYHLLLSQLIKNTPNTHEDYDGLRRAHDAMMDLGQYINEVKRDTEALQIINKIQNSISDLELPSDTHLVDYGRLVTDGELRVKSLDDSKVKSRYVFVFDKVILMCKSIRGVRGEQYCYKEALVLSEYEIDDNIIAANMQHTKHTTKEKWSHYFSLVKNGDKYIYTFFAKTLESKDKWLEYIKKAMDNSRPEVCRQGKTKHAFLMHTFDKATSCDHCSKLLHGRYYQGYRCQVCFLSAHKQCLVKTRACGTPSLPPRYLSTTPLSNLDPREPPSPSIKSSCSDEVFMTQSGNVSPGHNFMFAPQRTSESLDDLLESNQPRYGNISPQSLNVDGPSNNLLFFGKGCNYVNYVSEDYPWYSGRMERDRAQSLLESKPHGTFLVRVSPKQNGCYVISLNYNGQVKHMRIHVNEDNQLFLSQTRYFESLVELITWYERNSLMESFHLLDARLVLPFKGSNR